MKIHSVRHHIQKIFIDIVASIHYSEDINDTKILLGICSCLLKNTIGGQIDKKEIGITLQQYIVSFTYFIHLLFTEFTKYFGTTICSCLFTYLKLAPLIQNPWES